MRVTCGRFWCIWAGVRSGPPGVRGNATKSRSAVGRRTVGRALKKSSERRPYFAVRRRKRSEPAAASLPHLGAARPDAGAAILLQLEKPVRSCGTDPTQVLFSFVSRSREEGAGAGLSQGPGAPLARTAAAGLGPFARAPQP